jgi:hypothetical protein
VGRALCWVAKRNPSALSSPLIACFIWSEVLRVACQ